MKIGIALQAGIFAIITTLCFASCGGTLDEPFIVDSPESLLKVGTGRNGWGLNKHYRQTADIDMTGHEWTPIGEYEIIRTPVGKYDDIRFAKFDEKIINKPFKGSFDGNGCTITGLTIESYDDYQGMFGYIGTGGVVKNVALIGGSVSGSRYVGGLAGSNGGTVQSCYSTGDVTGTHMFAGGLVGYNSRSGKVRNCYTTGNIGKCRSVGGVVGDNKGVVRNCYVTGIISGTADNPVGGVVGELDEGGRADGCVGLNSSITRIGGYSDHSTHQFGRVVGWDWRGYHENNYGRRGMRLPVPIYEPVKSDADGIHGADITGAQWNKAGWWEKTAGFPSEAWDFRNGLPTLKGVGGSQNPVVR
ncbi:MAG: hypothetical protein FWG13_02410 [Leptospirales bacterium]|nr:hypothetical protein [Leptospirales bacterium]